MLPVIKDVACNCQILADTYQACQIIVWHSLLQLHQGTDYWKLLELSGLLNAGFETDRQMYPDWAKSDKKCKQVNEGTTPAVFVLKTENQT